MRIPREELRKRLLPARVLDQALPSVLSYSEAVAELYSVDPEDMAEAAGLGAWVAWETFDPQAGAAWSTWLRRNVNWYIAEALRDWGRDRHREVIAFRAQYTVLRLSDHVRSGGGADGDTLLNEDVLADPKSDFTAAILDRSATQHLLGQMLPRERAVFVGRYLDGQRKVDVAHQIGISPTRVTQVETQARTRLRQEQDAACRALFDALEAEPLPLAVTEPEAAGAVGK